MKLTLKVGVYCTFLLGLINIIVCIARYLVLMLPGLQSAGSSGASVGTSPPPPLSNILSVARVC